MKTLLLIAFYHILGLAGLIAFGAYLNDTITHYTAHFQGVTTLLSFAFGIYCFVINCLYHKNPHVHLLVNRILLMVRRTHTYWLPTYNLILSNNSLEYRRTLVEKVYTALKELPHKKITLQDETLTSAAICIDDKLFLVLQIGEQHLFATLDRKILVPSHLYETYQHTLARIGEILREAATPDSVQFGLTITFDDGVMNPYYGFFVRRVPSHILCHFEASFQFGHGSSCQIEVGTDSINIEGTSAVDFFAGVSQVLALEATPTGG